MSTILCGHAVPVKGLGAVADHTYVTSSDALAWGCWGRKDGGKVITKGAGSSGAAQCNSTLFGLSGIIYGVTGVCHQTSNRILLPARIHVGAAKGALVTYMLYGIFGMDAPGNIAGFCPIFLAKAFACGLANPKKLALLKAEVGDSSDAGSDEEALLIDDVISLHEKEIPNLYKEMKDEVKVDKNVELAKKTYKLLMAESGVKKSTELEENITADETKIMVKHRLGAEYDTTKVGQFVDLRAKLSKNTADCSASIVAIDSSADKLAQKMNDEVEKTLANMKEVLGESDYEEFFGHPDTNIKVVDPEILKQSFENRDMK